MQAVGVARTELWAWPGSDPSLPEMLVLPRATSSPVQCPALHLEQALHISEFRECVNINIKQITALCLLTSHCNVAFLSNMNVGPKAD